jgi:hypothetical protein
MEASRRRDGVVTRVRKAAAVSLMTPMVGAAIAVGLSHPAVAAEACPPLASASITPPTGTVTAGSSVHVTAKISGLMLLQAHLQISGPGLDKQVGKSVASGQIQGDVAVPKAGYFTLAVIGNGTSCTYQTAGFSARERASAAKPTQSRAPSKNPRPGRGGGNASPGALGPLPTGSPGSGGAGANNFGLNPLNGASPFSLPSVAPDGSGQGFQYPSPDPQVAAPPAVQPQARNVSETTPIKWGQSLAVALVLLVISAHLGMWSRRQRLAAEGARSTGGGKWMARRKKKATPETVAETTALADGPTATATVTPTSTATDTTAPITTAPSGTGPSGTGPSGTGPSDTGPSDTRLSETAATGASQAENNAAGPAVVAPEAAAPDDGASAEADAKRSAPRGYQGRRRRG